MTIRIETIGVTTHGRYLVEDTGPGGSRSLLIGFHGYSQHAGELLDELRRLVPAGRANAPPSVPHWRLVSVQGLHRFYRGRSATTVASWMTSEDRELLIADNVAYVDTVVDRVADGGPVDRLVYCGFSQGVAMAFRAACVGRHRANAVIAVGGDVPPELLGDPSAHFPRVLLARGERDEYYGADRLDADVQALRARNTTVDTLTFGGGHEWTDEFRHHAAALLEKWGC